METFWHKVLFKCSYQNLDIDIAEYDITGFSSRNRLETRLEYDRVLEELIPERIRKDYGARQKGALYGDGEYEKCSMKSASGISADPFTCLSTVCCEWRPSYHREQGSSGVFLLKKNKI